MDSANPATCYDSQRVYGNNESYRGSSFQTNNSDTLRIFTSLQDSPEYQQYAKQLLEGKSSLEGIAKFLARGDISAFKTALSASSLSNDAKFQIINLYVNKYPTNFDVLEFAGITYLNAGNIESGLELYDKVLRIGKLSSDGLYNYFSTLLIHKADHKESVEKAWQMMQQWQQQFASTVAPPSITRQIIQENLEIGCLGASYSLLCLVIKKYPAYHSILEDVIDMKDDSSTPTVVKMIITQALMVHFKGTPFENSLYRATGSRRKTSQEMREKG